MCHSNDCNHSSYHLDEMDEEVFPYFLSTGMTPEEEDAHRRFLRSQLEYDV